ncbi:MAG: hypothetical protein WBF99_05020 [Xanthobacteraceae bacterium]|jgi:hypothetical protein
MIKTALGVIAAVSLMATIPAAAQQKTAPGQKMQDKGSVKGTTGASGYAPGQKMQDKGSVKGTTGASGYAPGHANDAKSGTKSTK